jgi:hypothetical protein
MFEEETKTLFFRIPIKHKRPDRQTKKFKFQKSKMQRKANVKQLLNRT